MKAPRVSYEFFPPKSPVQGRRFWRAFGALETQRPDYVSITWGAQGSDCDASLALLEAVLQESALPVVAHLTCAGQTADAMHVTLDRLAALGITRILALRGDDVSGRDRPGALRHATDLVELLAARGGFEFSVSAYPEVHPAATSAGDDLHWLCHKADLGARCAITQFFFEPEPFLRLRDALAATGRDLPLVPGILPVHDIGAVAAFAAKCGSSVPEWLHRRFADARDDAARERIAVEQSSELCEELVREGVDQLHLYTLNRAPLSMAIVQRLRGGGGSAMERAA